MKYIYLIFCLVLAAEGFAGGFEYNAKTGLVSEKKKKLFVFKTMPDYRNEGSFVYNYFSVGGMQVCSIFKRSYADTTDNSGMGQIKYYYEVLFYDEVQSKAELEYTEDKMKIIELLKQANMLKGDDLDENAKLAFLKKYAHSVTGK